MMISGHRVFLQHPACMLQNERMTVLAFYGDENQNHNLKVMTTAEYERLIAGTSLWNRFLMRFSSASWRSIRLSLVLWFVGLLLMAFLNIDRPVVLYYMELLAILVGFATYSCLFEDRRILRINGAMNILLNHLADAESRDESCLAVDPEDLKTDSLFDMIFPFKLFLDIPILLFIFFICTSMSFMFCCFFILLFNAFTRDMGVKSSYLRRSHILNFIAKILHISEVFTVAWPTKKERELVALCYNALCDATGDSLLKQFTSQ